MSTQFTTKSPDEIRDDILTTLENGLRDRGVTNPNCGPGSDWYVLATALAQQLAVVGANTTIKADAMMPDTATGDDLDRVCAIYELPRRAPTVASGNVIYSASQSATIAAGTQLVDAYGQLYSVATTGTYADDDPIPVVSVDAGEGTNHPAQDVLRWLTPPTGASSSVAVATGGLTGGLDEEDDETLRARLYSRLRTPPGSGNWEHVAEIAEASSTSVQKAFVYPAVNGPATYAVAVAGYQTTSVSASATRALASSLVTNTIAPYVTGHMPEYAEGYVTGCIDYPVDLAIGLALPAATTASPPGPGGGWVDASPWPASASAPNSFKCTVTAAASATEITVDATSAPVDGITHISYIDCTDWTLYTALVTSHSGSSGAYTIELDDDFTNIDAGDFVFPSSENAQVYLDAILAAFAAMGPGEKGAPGSDARRRGYRHPLPAQAWPYSLGAVQMRAMTDASEEVLSAQINYASATSPALAVTVKTAPYILTPRSIGFYFL